MLVTTVNLLAVLAVTVISLGIGWLWYSPLLFGKAWVAYLGKSEAELAATKKRGGKAMALEALATLVKAYVLAVFVTSAGAASATDGILIGLWLWLGLVVTTNLSSVTFEGRPKGTYLIGITCQLVTLVVMGALLAVWQ